MVGYEKCPWVSHSLRLCVTLFNVVIRYMTMGPKEGKGTRLLWVTGVSASSWGAHGQQECEAAGHIKSRQEAERWALRLSLLSPFCSVWNANPWNGTTPI